MKRQLPYFWAAMFAAVALPAAAQTQENPLTLVEGENVVVREEGSTETFFKYKADSNVQVYIDGYGASNYYMYHPYYLDAAGDMQYIPYSYSNYGDQYMLFNAEKGVEYFFAMMDNGIEKIDCTITPLAGSAYGANVDDPLVIPVSGEFLFPVSDGSVVYAKYTAPASGRLVLTTSESLQTLAVGTDPENITDFLESDYGGSYNYRYECMVEEGKTYYFQAKGYTAPLVSVEVQEVIPGGSCKDAWDIEAGENVIPAEAGTYWYTAVTPKEGAIVVSSTADVTMEILAGCGYTNGKFYSTPDFRYSVVSANSRYYFKVVKATATSGEEKFTLEFDDILPIENATEGQTFEAGESVTTPSAAAYYYYSITAPEGEPTLCVVTSNSTNNDSWSGAITVSVPGAWGNKGCGANFEFQADPGQKYIFKLNVYENEPITFEANFKELEKGALETYPLEAVVGSNNTPGFSPVYYTYKETEGSKLEVKSLMEGAVVSVSISGDSYTTVETKPIDNGFTFMPTAGTTYIFKVVKPEDKKNETTELVLTQLPFDEGEAWQTAIEVEAGATELPASPFNVWYKIKATQNGFLTVNTDMPYNYSNLANVYVGSVAGNPKGLDYDYNTYLYKETKFGVSEGDWAYIQLKQTATAEAGAYTLTLGFEEALPGQTYGTAIPVEYEDGGVALEVSGMLGYNVNMWYSIDLPAGILSITSTDSFNINLYEASNPNTNVTSGNTSYGGGESGIMGYVISEPAKYYFTISGTQGWGDNAKESIQINISVREPQVGETFEDPYVIEGPATVEIPVLNNREFWVKMNLVPGELSVVGEENKYMNGKLFSADNLDKEIATTSSSFDDVTYSYTYGIFNKTITEAGVYYFAPYYNENVNAVTFSGSALGAAEAGFPEFPAELNITFDVEGLEMDQEFDENVLNIMVMGESPKSDVNVTFEIPAGWDGFIGTPLDFGGFSLEGTPVDEFEQIMGEDGIEVLKGNEFTFTADSRAHLYNFYLYKDDVIYEEAGIMFGFMVDCTKSDVTVSVAVEDGASFSYNVPFEAATGFSLALPADFVVEAAELNGEEIEVADKYEFTVGEEDMNYVFTVAYDGELAFVDTTTGMVSLDTRVKIGVAEGKIRIEGTEVGDVVAVYTVGGMTVGTYTAQNTALDIEVAKGTYVVRVNNVAAKVIL